MTGAVLITGAGQGLGRALVRGFLDRGARVIGIDPEPEALAETASAPDFMAMPGNGADPDFVADLFARLDREGHRVGVLFNSARIEPRGDFLDMAPDDWLAAMRHHLHAAVMCSHHALRHMAVTGRGRIISVGSFSDLAPLPGQSAYAVSKGSLRLLTRALVADLGDRFPGIIINDWCPGPIEGERGVETGIDPARAARWGMALAGLNDPVLNGSVFAGYREQRPRPGLKARALALVGLRRIRPGVVLDG